MAIAKAGGPRREQRMLLPRRTERRTHGPRPPRAFERVRRERDRLTDERPVAADAGTDDEHPRTGPRPRAARSTRDRARWPSSRRPRRRAAAAPSRRVHAGRSGPRTPIAPTIAGAALRAAPHRVLASSGARAHRSAAGRRLGRVRPGARSWLSHRRRAQAARTRLCSRATSSSCECTPSFGTSTSRVADRVDAEPERPRDLGDALAAQQRRPMSPSRAKARRRVGRQRARTPAAAVPRVAAHGGVTPGMAIAGTGASQAHRERARRSSRWARSTPVPRSQFRA